MLPFCSSCPVATILRNIYCNIILIAGSQSRAQWRTYFVWSVCCNPFVFIVVAGGLFFSPVASENRGVDVFLTSGFLQRSRSFAAVSHSDSDSESNYELQLIFPSW